MEIPILVVNNASIEAALNSGLTSNLNSATNAQLMFLSENLTSGMASHTATVENVGSKRQLPSEWQPEKRLYWRNGLLRLVNVEDDPQYRNLERTRCKFCIMTLTAMGPATMDEWNECLRRCYRYRTRNNMITGDMLNALRFDDDI
jgi:hypothetical protein